MEHHASANLPFLYFLDSEVTTQELFCNFYIGGLNQFNKCVIIFILSSCVCVCRLIPDVSFLNAFNHCQNFVINAHHQCCIFRCFVAHQSSSSIVVINLGYFSLCYSRSVLSLVLNSSMPLCLLLNKTVTWSKYMLCCWLRFFSALRIYGVCNLHYLKEDSSTTQDST
jgi:hypothetical protein